MTTSRSFRPSFPIAPNNSVFKIANTREYVWDRPVELLICPSFPGENIDAGGRKWRPLTKPQVSNYHALAAGCVDGSRHTVADTNPTTGGMIVTKQASPKGLKIGDCKDGTSKTAIITESRREQYTAWFSGAATIDVAIPPELAQCAKILRNKPDGYPAPAADVANGLNYGVRLDAPAAVKKTTPQFWAARDLNWGPSSAHSGDVVMTGYSDGHVKALNSGIDAGVYFRLVTRGGSEPANDG